MGRTLSWHLLTPGSCSQGFLAGLEGHQLLQVRGSLRTPSHLIPAAESEGSQDHPQSGVYWEDSGLLKLSYSTFQLFQWEDRLQSAKGRGAGGGVQGIPHRDLLLAPPCGVMSTALLPRPVCDDMHGVLSTMGAP